VLVWVVLALVFAPFVIAVLVAIDLFANRTDVDSDHFRSELLHLLAWPFEIAIGVAMAAFVVWVCGYVTVKGARPLADGLLLTIYGRSTTGVVTEHLGTERARGADEDSVPFARWQVEFIDGHGTPRFGTYTVAVSTKHPVHVGTTLRVRHQLNRPGNTWVRRPGWSSWTGGILTYLVLFAVWAFVASAPAALLYWSVRRIPHLLTSL
jgi:hypothetical protein